MVLVLGTVAGGLLGLMAEWLIARHGWKAGALMGVIALVAAWACAFAAGTLALVATFTIGYTASHAAHGRLRISQPPQPLSRREQRVLSMMVFYLVLVVVTLVRGEPGGAGFLVAAGIAIGAAGYVLDRIDRVPPA